MTGRYLLIGILILAVLIRFLYFPDNVYFGYDQARDAFISTGILEGRFKILGPPATFSTSLFHGPLGYYLFAPFYFLSGGDPSLPSVFLRVFNASGIFVVFLTASILFDKRKAFLAALLFALSYEQTQYALFLSHPSFGVLTVLLIYYGLARIFFLKDQRGLIIALTSFGLSIQFHLSLLLLLIPITSLFILFRKKLPHFSTKIILLSSVCFLLTISTFILAEIKYGHFQSFSIESGGEMIEKLNLLTRAQFQVNRFVRDNLIAYQEEGIWGTVILILMFYIIFSGKKNKSQNIFLLVWFLGGLFPYLITNTKIYYYGMGGSVSLLVFASVVIDWGYQKSKVLGLLLILIIVFSNLYLIIKNNRVEFNKYIVVEEGLVIPREKEALDYIYSKAFGKPFSVNAVTIPFNVKTTWDYLFNWYGQQKYGYTPVWGGDAAIGYEGKLPVNRARSELPKIRFVIIEPEKNIPSYLREGLINEENYFSKILEVRKFGNITVQTREAY